MRGLGKGRYEAVRRLHDKAGVPLVHHPKELKAYEALSDQPTQGVRAQICVTDYDGDGRQDLLVGDYSQLRPLRKLTPVERTAFGALVKEETDLIEGLWGTGSEATPSQKETHAKLGKAKKTYFADPEAKAPTSSFVWLYLRSPKS